MADWEIQRTTGLGASATWTVVSTLTDNTEPEAVTATQAHIATETTSDLTSGAVRVRLRMVTG